MIPHRRPFYKKPIVESDQPSRAATRAGNVHDMLAFKTPAFSRGWFGVLRAGRVGELRGKSVKSMEM
jgi:hypothetical protein